MATNLETIAAEADAVADDQRRVARDARTMQRRLERGWSWSRVLGDEQPVHILERARASSKRLVGLTGHLGLTIARALAGEGESRRRIASRLGVSHQRVTAMLRSRARSRA
jgi:hypothetical protein